jgi:hypothetical protein
MILSVKMKLMLSEMCALDRPKIEQSANAINLGDIEVKNIVQFHHLNSLAVIYCTLLTGYDMRKGNMLSDGQFYADQPTWQKSLEALEVKIVAGGSSLPLAAAA